MTEEWRPAPMIPQYEVSSNGNVRHRLTKRVRILRKDKKGYQCIDFHISGFGNRQFKVHRLICEAFHGPCPPDHQCAHGNGNRADNRQNNLRWVTAIENSHDRELHGRTSRGSKRPNAKLTTSDVKAILEELAHGRSTLRSIGKKFGVGHDKIYRIKAGKSYIEEASHDWH